MVPQEVVDEVAARLRDCVRGELHANDMVCDALDNKTLELFARRAVEVMTTYAQVTWPDPEDA